MSTTIKQSLDWARTILEGVADNPRLEAEILLGHSLSKSRSFIHTWPDQSLSLSVHASFQQLVEERRGGVPIAYLTGQREFWGLNLRVTRDTLIPRPETEHLVETALSHIPKNAEWRIADLGTGSGAIALAIASERPNCQIIATDISHAALAIAGENARSLGLDNVCFINSRWYEGLADESLTMICSNPPYIDPEDTHLRRGDLRFEPPGALSAAEHGLADLREIIELAPQYLPPGGWLLLEHGYQQGKVTQALLAKAGFCAIETLQDYAGLERVSIGKTPP